jgi:hypothetical protein
LLLRGIFHSQCEIFLTLAAGNRIRVAAGRIAVHPLCLPEQQTIERRKEIFHGKESQEGRQESSQEGQVTAPYSPIWFAKALRLSCGTAIPG